jgi:hypothetical protein
MISEHTLINRITGYLDKKNIDFSIHKPGDDNEKMVFVANWNNVPGKL